MLSSKSRQVQEQELQLYTPNIDSNTDFLLEQSQNLMDCQQQLADENPIPQLGKEEEEQLLVNSQNNNIQDIYCNENEYLNRNPTLRQNYHNNEQYTVQHRSNIENQHICLDFIFIIQKQQNLEKWIGHFYNYMIELIQQNFSQITDNRFQLRLGVIFQQKSKIEKFELSSNILDIVEILKKKEIWNKNDVEEDLQNQSQNNNQFENRNARLIQSSEFLKQSDLVQLEEKGIFQTDEVEENQIAENSEGKELQSFSDADDDLTEVLKAAYQLNYCNHPDSILKLILLNQHFQLELLLNQEKEKINLQKALNCLKLKKQNFQFSTFSLDQNNKIIKNNKIDGLDCKFFNTKKNMQKYLKQEIEESLGLVKYQMNYQEQKQLIQANFQEQKIMPFNYVEGIFEDYINHLIKETKIDGTTNLYIDQQHMGNEQNKIKNDWICYKAYDEYHKIYVMLKIPSFIVNSQGNLSQEDIQKAEELAQVQYQEQYITVLLLNSFNEQLKKPSLNSNIKNSNPQVYGAKPFIFNLSNPYLGLTKIYGEIFLQVPSQWKTYENFCQEDHAMSAFFHYSSFKTKKKLIITSIQGKENLLCKPKISFNSPKELHFPSKIHQTKCNSLCKTFLKLKPQDYKVMQLKFKENYFLCQICNIISLVDNIFINFVINTINYNQIHLDQDLLESHVDDDDDSNQDDDDDSNQDDDDDSNQDDDDDSNQAVKK